MIQPTNGRIVWFHPPTDDPDLVQHDQDKPLAAVVVHVWDNRCVNLVVFDSDGNSRPQTSVPLLQDDDQPSPNGYYCEWMPYQKGQVAKTEAVEKSALLGAEATRQEPTSY